MAGNPKNHDDTVRPIRNSAKAHPVFCLIIALLILCLVLWQVSLIYQESLIADKRTTTDNQLVLYRNNLESSLQKRFIIFSGVAAHVQSSVEEGKYEDFTGYLADIYPEATGIRNFGIAPGGVQTWVYPFEGNENVQGHDLLNDTRPDVQADVQSAINTGETTISGPYELRQGGQGLILRKAVKDNGSFWGLVTMVLDMPPLISEALGPHGTNGLELAIRDSDGTVFYGDTALFENTPVIRRVLIYNEFWEIGAIPAGGWDASVQDAMKVFWVSGFIVVFLVMIIIIMVIISHSRLAWTVKDRTRELEKEKMTLSRLNRALKVISECNGILVRTGNEQDLMDLICSTLVTTGNYPLAIIGRYSSNGDRNELVPLAFASTSGMTVPDILKKKQGLVPEAVLAGNALLTGHPWVEKCSADSHDDPMKRICDICPVCRSVITFPLQTDGQPSLFLIIYSDNEDSFDTEEIDLLDQLASDMAFGIKSIRTWMARVAAEKDLLIKGFALNSSVNGIALANLSGRVTYANQAFLLMFGYENESDVLSKPIDYFGHANARELELIPKIMDSVRKKGSWTGEINPVRKDGTSFYAQLSVSMVRGKDGETTGMMASFIDITEMKEAYEKISFQAGILDVVSEAIIAVDAGYRIMSWNPMAESLFGWTEEEVMGRVPSEVLKTDFTGTNQLEHYRISREEGIYHGHVIQYAKNGKKIYVSLSTIAMKDKEGNISGYVKVLHDITDQTRLEELKRQAFSRIEQNFTELAILNDQIRNPLSVIVGLADMEPTNVNKKILEQALEIDRIITRLDRGWVESGKVREFLKKHYGMGNRNEEPEEK
jgi:PAS domain S-box-containing protein